MRILSLFFVLTVILSINAIAQPCNQQVVASYSPTIVCSTRDVQLNVTTITGAGYNWAGPGGFNTTQQNPLLSNIQPSGSGDYIVTVTDGSCVYKDTVTITVNPTPPMPVVQHNSPICYGDTISMIGLFTPTIGMWEYWYGPNNFTAYGMANDSVNRLYADSSMDGQYKTVFVSVAGCPSDTVYFNVSVLHNVTPYVTITTDTVKTGPYTPVTFTAHVINGGQQPTYQWRKNSVDIAGATNSTYTAVSAVNLVHGDTITVAVTADTACGQTGISNILIYYLDLGVHDINTNRIALYPNPNDGKFSLSLPPAPSQGRREMFVEVVNAVGQTILNSKFQNPNSKVEIELPGNVANGMYLLRVNIEGESYHARFTLNR